MHSFALRVEGLAAGRCHLSKINDREKRDTGKHMRHATSTRRVGEACTDFITQQPQQQQQHRLLCHIANDFHLTLNYLIPVLFILAVFVELLTARSTAECCLCVVCVLYVRIL